VSLEPADTQNGGLGAEDLEAVEFVGVFAVGVAMDLGGGAHVAGGLDGGDFFLQLRGVELGQVEVGDGVGVELPARRDHRFDVARAEVGAFGLQVEHPRPAVAAQLRQRVGELRPVAVVEGDDDRLGRQRAAVVPGFLDLFQGHRLVAVLVEPVHLPVEDGTGDVEVGIGLVGQRRPQHVVLEDRHGAGVGAPVGLRRRIADLARP